MRTKISLEVLANTIQRDFQQLEKKLENGCFIIQQEK